MALSLISLNPDLYPPGVFQIPAGTASFLVGREIGNELQVNHTSVSARHARIEINDGELVDVVDCGSTNGTFVNGIQVERKQLVDGDLLRFATAEFRVSAAPVAHLNGLTGLNGATQAISLSALGNHRSLPDPVEQERDELRIEVERLSAEAAELNGYLLGWQECVSSRDQEIERLTGILTDGEAVISGLTSTQTALSTEIAELSGKLDKLSRKLEEGEREKQSLIVGHRAEVLGLSAKIEEGEKALAAFSTSSGTEIEQLRSRLAAREAELKKLSESSAEEIRNLKGRLKDGEESFKSLSRDTEAEIKGLKKTIAERETDFKALSVKRESEVQTLSEKLAGEEGTSRQLKREIEDLLQREQRNLAQISETRKELMDRESRIAALHYEVTTRDGNIVQITNQRLQSQQANDLALAEITELKAALEQEKQNVAAARESQNIAEAASSDILNRLFKLGDRLYSEWSGWFREGDKSPAHGDATATFSRINELAGRIRSELDVIEPVWRQFGDHVQEELAARCGAFREEEAELSDEILDRQAELASLKADLDQFRELIDVEVRRAQGLSRRGTEIEIPERFEPMVIAKDREQEIYRSLIERLEVLDRLLEGYRGSRKLREVTKELSEFRLRLAAILESSGVESFQVEVGTFLSLKHRREVQILSRKGWGTSQYSEFPFRPGEVVKVVRPGYRVGGGESAVILRKVEVLIRGVED